MLKYNFLLFHQDFRQFLEDLMELGIVDISWTEDLPNEEIEELNRNIKTVELLHKRLSKRKRKTPPNNGMHMEPSIDAIITLEEEREEIERKTILLQKEIALLEPWGNIDWDKQRRLEENGVKVRFFQCPIKQFEKSWEVQYPLEVINRIGSKMYFVVFDKEIDIDLPVHPSSLPKKSLNELKLQLEELETRIDTINDQLDSFTADYLDKLEDQLAIAKDRLGFKQAFQHVNHMPDHQLVLVEGWCPKGNKDKLDAYLDEHKIAYQTGEPTKEENPPVLLKNNRFTRLFEPIGGLFSLPANTELDLTPYFAPFFLLFFGFCIGDAGYGIVLLLATTIAKSRVDTAQKSYMTLAQLFGISTLIMGVLSGTFFGLELAKEPALAAFKDTFMDQDQLFNLALIIGFIQIIFGIGIRAYKSFRFDGWKFAMSPIGWILALLSGVDLLVTEVMPAISNIFLIIGLIMIVLFGNPRKPFLLSAGFGILDLYNVTGVIGDLLSYIRLFALGVSSAILGLVVNNIALKALGLPYIGWVFFLLILIIGHTGNLLLASLSAFVHPMRLTFVEFYKNAGFEGGGKAFRPFAKNRPGEPIEPEKTEITLS